MNQLVKGHIVFDHDGTLAYPGQYQMMIYPGMRDLLLKLKSLNFNLYVWTARGRASTLKSLKDNQIVELFTDISSPDDAMMKPHPMGLQKMLDGIDKKNVLHIGDSRGDLEGAKNFGIEFVFAAWGNKENGELFQSFTEMVAFDLNELEKYIEIKFNH